MTDEGDGGASRPLFMRGLRRRHWRALLIDPPWRFHSYAKPSSANPDSDRSVERHYKTMTFDDVAALPIQELAHPDGCHLFLWTTGPHLPQALKLMSAWGFRYSGVQHTWAKLKRSFNPRQLRVLPAIDGDFHFGLGHTSRKNAEFVLLGRRGNARRVAKNVRELILAPVREHSRKPDEIHGLVERYCAGPYLELFGRKSVEGWTVRGDEARKFDDAA